MHECQEIRSANINQKEDRFLIYERDLLFYAKNMNQYTDNLYIQPIHDLLGFN